MPRVSVIIPTYNRQQMLKRAIKSVLAQTFTDFEILVVDDGSTDGTAAMVNAIEDRRIVYIHQKHSGLPAVARNTGLKIAQGEYIAFLDSDDLWLPEKLEVQVTFMDLEPDAGLSFTDVWFFVSNPDKYWPATTRYPLTTQCSFAFDHLYGHTFIHNLAVMIRSEVVKTVGGLNEDPSLKSIEDYEYWLRIAYHYKICYIDLRLAKYNRHTQGISKAGSTPFENVLHLFALIDESFPIVKTRLAAERLTWLSSIHHHLGIAYLRERRYSEAYNHLYHSLKLRPADFIFRTVTYPARISMRYLARLRAVNPLSIGN